MSTPTMIRHHETPEGIIATVITTFDRQSRLIAYFHTYKKCAGDQTRQVLLNTYSSYGEGPCNAKFDAWVKVADTLPPALCRECQQPLTSKDHQCK